MNWQGLNRHLDVLWYGGRSYGALLTPLSALFRVAGRVRRALYRSGIVPARRFDVPIVVVGNISVGGTGKTPLVIWLAKFLEKNNYKLGIVCRGYRGRAGEWPQRVGPDSDPNLVGDEPVLLARRTGRPVFAAPARADAVAALLAEAGCDVVVCDDGLQHLALARDVEIAVVDSVRRHGNRFCLPAGPLREPIARLREVDLIVANGAAEDGEFEMRLVPGELCKLRDTSERRELESLRGCSVHAVAGIGNPARFFDTLCEAGLKPIPHPFPDHHDFVAKDIDFADELPIIMTEKDAVKCAAFATTRHWYLPVEATLHPLFGERILALIKENTHGQEAA